jgi:hypothetical protein
MTPHPLDRWALALAVAALALAAGVSAVDEAHTRRGLYTPSQDGR